MENIFREYLDHNLKFFYHYIIKYHFPLKK